MSVRTDLAVERLESGEVTSDNLEHRQYTCEGVACVRVRQPDGGTYLTLSLDELMRREQESFAHACRAVAAQLRELVPRLRAQAPVLVIGLGNRSVTPDAVGPLCCQSVLATRHLTGAEPILDGFRPVSVLAPGVLGTTGVETGEIVRGLLENIRPELQDASQPRPEWVESMDVVLADVPCSGYGIIRKKPDIRYKDIHETEKLPELQEKILLQQAEYVKPGGTLLYSTCTVLRRENEEVVASFLARRPDFERVPLRLPEGFPPNTTGMLSLLPGEYDTDGFFICRMRRKA